jgi:hypothetical protein
VNKENKTVMHKLLSLAGVSNVLLHVVLLATFVSVFFFTWGSRVEKEVVKKQTNAVVDSFSQDIKLFVPADQLAQWKPYLDQFLVPPDMAEQDKEAADKNKALLVKTAKIIGLVDGVAILLIIILWIVGMKAAGGKYQFSMTNLLKENAVILLFVAITEFAFVSLVAGNYKSADPNLVKLAIVQSLQNYANQSS